MSCDRVGKCEDYPYCDGCNGNELRGMTLEQAIKHCHEKAEEIREANEEMPTDCKLSEDLCECAEEHEQLAEWLKDYKRLLETPRGDLISRSALKEEVKGLFCPDGYKLDFIKTIDNALTIETKECPYSCEKCAKKMICELGKEMNRPKGKWIKEDNGKTTDVYRCSICGRSIMLCKNADLSKYPFCHCGADMQKGGAE